VKKSLISNFWKQYFAIFEYNDIREITEENLNKFNNKLYTKKMLSEKTWTKIIKGVA
jgi:hypothetical protein